LKRIAVAVTGAALAVVLGAGAAAWAGPGLTPDERAAARACLDDARQADPDAGRAAIREAARPCLEAAGLTPRPRTPEQQAAREALRACLKDLRQAHPDAGRQELRDLARPCLEQVGVTPGTAREKLRACVDKARRASPDADRKALRPAVKECMGR